MSIQVDDFDGRVGRRIAVTRKAAGLSQSTLGAAIGVTFQQVQKYEKGINRVSVGALQRIADAVGVQAHFFLDPRHRDGADRSAPPTDDVAEQAQILGRAWSQIADHDLQSKLFILIYSLGSDKSAV